MGRPENNVGADLFLKQFDHLRLTRQLPYPRLLLVSGIDRGRVAPGLQAGEHAIDLGAAVSQAFVSEESVEDVIAALEIAGVRFVVVAKIVVDQLHRDSMRCANGPDKALNSLSLSGRGPG